MRRILWVPIGLAVATALWTRPAAAQDQNQGLNGLLVDYGVPSSPAFELLPDKPTDISHITTPRDLSVLASTWVSRSQLKTGMALDARPLALLAGPLTTYAGSLLRQLAWRSVLSAGTSPEAANSGKNVLFALGWRLPIVDGADPRADSQYIHDLEKAYTDALHAMPQCPLEGNCAMPDADSATKSVREAFAKNHWNAFRLDAGLAWLVRADSGYLRPDSLNSDRVGVWVAAERGIAHLAQVTLAVQASGIAAHQRSDESARYLAGGSVRFFPADWVDISVEGERTWSHYRDSSSLNESWNHFAVGAEVKVPILSGWIGVGYGGDTAHRTNSTSRFSLQYAYAKDRKFKS